MWDKMLRNQFELWLIWQNPFSRQRYHVGTLVHDSSGYCFTYRTQGQRSLNDALLDGYQPHLSFPDLNKVYQAPSLFGEFAIEFFVAGWRYYDGDTIVKHLCSGQTVELELEPDNPRDHNAVVVLILGDRKLGYVPAYYSWFMNEVIRTQNDFKAVIKEFNPGADEKSRLRIEVRGKLYKHAPTFLSQLCAV